MMISLMDFLTLRSLLLLARDALAQPDELSDVGRKLLIEAIDEFAAEKGWIKDKVL